jgi:hypothetical protein
LIHHKPSVGQRHAVEIIVAARHTVEIELVATIQLVVAIKPVAVIHVVG